MTFRKINSHIQGHPNMSIKGVDMSTGSLGQGLSSAVGMAMSYKIHHQDFRVYALVGDGESEEGQIWEAAMAAAHYKLDNLVAILEFNGLQISAVPQNQAWQRKWRRIAIATWASQKAT